MISVTVKCESFVRTHLVSVDNNSCNDSYYYIVFFLLNDCSVNDYTVQPK